MTPFQAFRLWLRRASVSDRATTLAAGAVAVALLAWAFVPAGVGGESAGALAAGTSSPGTSSPGTAVAPGTRPVGSAPGTALPAPGAAVTPGAPVSPGPGDSSPLVLRTPLAGTTTSPPAGDRGRTGCTPPGGSDQGITAKEVSVAVVTINIGGSNGNATFGLPSPEEQQQNYDYIISALNSTGGVFCRKLVARYYQVNPEDTTAQQQACLDIVATRVFAVLDTGGYFQSPSASCFPQNKLPFFTTTGLFKEQVNTFYPHMFSFLNVEVIYRNMVFALRQRGFFSAGNGFEKLGYIYRDCFPSIRTSFDGWLKQAGVGASQIVSYNMGCPETEVAVADLQQAILSFKQAGVTHMSAIQESQDMLTFTQIAEQQGFRPKYGLADDGIIALTKGRLHPDYNNLANAIVIAATRYGEENSGVAPTPGTNRCNAIFASHARPTVYKQAAGLAGNSCSLVWMFAAAANHAPAMQRTALAAGLQAARSIELSFPQGPVDWSGPRTTYGGQFWRAEQFYTSCNCWKLLERAFNPSFA